MTGIPLWIQNETALTRQPVPTQTPNTVRELIHKAGLGIRGETSQMKSRRPAGGRAPRARWGPLLTGRGHSLEVVSSGAHISHHAMTTYKKGGKLRPAQVTRNRVYLQEQNCMWNTQTQVSDRRVCRLRAGCICGHRVQKEKIQRGAVRQLH